MSTTMIESHPDHHEHHEMPTSGTALTQVALSATLHCLTGCAIGEVLGMVIGTALGFSQWGTVALAVTLAFVFGYALTSLPLLRAGLAWSAVVPIALASDTLSIATMEIVDNALMVAIPGAMESGVGSLLFWGSLSFALVVAGAVAVPVNRWLIARGKGHAVVHETGVHGGLSPRTVGIAAAITFAFGSWVLIAELLDDAPAGADHGSMQQAATPGHGRQAAAPEHGAEQAAHGETVDSARGLSATAAGLTLELDQAQLPQGEPTRLSFRVREDAGAAVRDFDVEHDKRMHLIVVRRDLSGFQHLHPALSAAGTWSTKLTLATAGSYRVFADFKHDGRRQTLARTITVPGSLEPVTLPAPASTATSGGYAIRMTADGAHADAESDLAFDVTRDGRAVKLEPYLGARGHLVELRSTDLAYLHVHPTQIAARTGQVAFATRFPSAGRYRLYLQFKHAGRVRTAEFTTPVPR